MPPRGLLDVLVPAKNSAPPTGLLDASLYGNRAAAAQPAWQRAIQGFSNFTDNYVGRPVADATAATLGLPGDAYLAGSKLLGLPLGINPNDADLGYGRHVLPTSGDFQRLMAPLFESTPLPSSPGGRIAQAALTGAASLPFGGEGPSVLAFLRDGVSGALPQAANEATDDQSVRLAASLLPILLGSTKKVRTLPGIGEVGNSGFKLLKIDLGRQGDSLAYRNPTETQMRNLAARDKYTTLRWLRTPENDVWVFPAWNTSHYEMNRLLGLEGDPKNTGQILLENGKWEIIPNEW